MVGVRVTNEIEPVRRVLLHRPGLETKNFAADEFEQVFSLRKWSKRFDFDKALAEHESLVRLLRSQGIESVYLDELLVEALDSHESARTELTDDYLSLCGAKGKEMLEAVRDRLDRAATNRDFANTVIRGIHYGETKLADASRPTLAATIGASFNPQTLMVNPLNTLFFTRDPASIIGNSVLLNHMYWPERNREISLYRTVIRHHPAFAGTQIVDLNHSSFHIEGGDVLNLAPGVIAVGISARTEPAAIDAISQLLLQSDENTPSPVSCIYAIQVPENGIQVHLDTFLNRIDYDKFLVDPELLTKTTIYRIALNHQTKTLKIEHLDEPLRTALTHAVGEPVQFVLCGDGDPLAAERERITNATAVFALAPNKLCVYEQNVVTNRALEQAGAQLYPLSIEELTKGYGGPNCICLPLWREE